MIKEFGTDTRYLDISQISMMGFTQKIAYCEGITTQFRTSDKQPFLKFSLLDVNGRQVRGFWWEADQIKYEKIQWAVGHLVLLECSPVFGSGLEISGIMDIPEDMNEAEILTDNFKLKLQGLSKKVTALETTISQTMGDSPAKEVYGILQRRGAIQTLSASRDSRICSGAVGGPIVRLITMTTATVYAKEMYGLTIAECRVVVLSAVVYEYLVAVHKPIKSVQKPNWKVDALNELSVIAGIQASGEAAEVLDSVVSCVLELLGLSDCHTKIGAIIENLRECVTELSELAGCMDSQIGDVEVEISGKRYIRNTLQK